MSYAVVGGIIGESSSGVKAHATIGAPTTVDLYGVLSFDVLGDQYRQMGIPYGSDWHLERRSTGAVRILWSHDNQLCWNKRSPELYGSGANNRAGADPGVLLVSDATPTTLNLDNTTGTLAKLGVYNLDGVSTGDGIYTVNVGIDDTSCYFSCFETDEELQIISLGVFCKTTNSATLAVKASLYQSARGYHQQQLPWKMAWPGAKWNHSAAAVTGQNYLAWATDGYPEWIPANRYHVRAYWSCSANIELFARAMVDGGNGMKGDRVLANGGTYGGSYASPNFADLYPGEVFTSNPTSNAGNPTSTNRASVDFFMIGVPRGR